MPPNKLTKQKVIQDQNIAARLIEISFEVEDCIYKKKSISVDRAVKYKAEVALFENKCIGDERALQVIEKLKHFMKSIIECHGKTDSASVSQSPPTALDVASSDPPLLDRFNKTTCSIQVQTEEFCDPPESPIVNKTIKKKALDKSSVTMTGLLVTSDVEIDLERTLSNLSLSIIDPINNEMYSDIINAPTLIESVKENEYLNNSEGKLEVIDLTTSLSDPNLPSQDHIMQIIPTVSVSEYNNNITDDINTNKLIPLKMPQNNCMSVDFREQVSTICTKIIAPRKKSKVGSYKETSNEFALNVGTADHKKNTVECKDTKSKGTRNVTKRVRKNKKESKEKGENAQIKPKKARAKRKSKVINTENNTLTDNLTQNAKENYGKHNTDADSDLSWIEKLKFIRIIDPLEVDCSLEFPESFWYDDSLPANCRDYL